MALELHPQPRSPRRTTKQRDAAASARTAASCPKSPRRRPRAAAPRDAALRRAPPAALARRPPPTRCRTSCPIPAEWPRCRWSSPRRSPANTRCAPCAPWPARHRAGAGQAPRPCPGQEPGRRRRRDRDADKLVAGLLEGGKGTRQEVKRKATVEVPDAGAQGRHRLPHEPRVQEGRQGRSGGGRAAREAGGQHPKLERLNLKLDLDLKTKG